MLTENVATVLETDECNWNDGEQLASTATLNISLKIPPRDTVKKVNSQVTNWECICPHINDRAINIEDDKQP